MKIVLTILAFILGIHACDKDLEPGDTPKQFLSVTLDPGIRYQTIHHFGASDAWSCQFIGKNWPTSKKERMADLLFSNRTKSDGSPEGIGLSSWRFNLGAGSTQQGASSEIHDAWRRGESFLNAEGEFSPQGQKGQRWFLKAANKRGVETFFGFVNSPPVNITRNGKAFSSGGKSSNLSQDKYDDFAEYLIQVADFLSDNDGIKLNYLSPFNEPQWDWRDGGQEGSPWLNTEMAAFTRVLDAALSEAALDIKIDIAEAGQIQYLYSNYNRPERGNQIHAFFNENSSSYVGNLEHVAHQISGHSYYTTWDLTTLTSTRKLLASTINSYPDLEYNMSEYTLLENNEMVKGPGRDLGINPALYMARVIHTDLVLAGASSWQWWLAISPYDYKDGLIYTDLNKNDGQFYESKMLWALGNYSCFIRPGMTRIKVSKDDNRSLEQSLGGLMVSSFLDSQNGQTVTVVINMGQSPIPIKLLQEKKNTRFKMYRTDGGQNNLSFVGETNFTEATLVPGKSITTFVED